jgi:hypothetical protein
VADVLKEGTMNEVEELFFYFKVNTHSIMTSSDYVRIIPQPHLNVTLRLYTSF